MDPLPSNIVMSKLNVRAAIGRDLESLVSFNAAMALETEGRCLDNNTLRLGIQSVLDNREHGFYLVAEIPSDPLPCLIGQLLVTYEWSDWRNGQFWWVQSVYIHPACRGKGVFRQLYEWVRIEAQSQPMVVGIRLYVEDNNTQAQEVYKKLGLAPTAYRIFEQEFPPR